MSRLLLACFLLGTLLPAAAQTESPPAAAPAGDESVLVVGQRPGPGLWKVSKGDNVLWIFGTHTPLPKKMEWRSRQAEAVLAASQEYIGLPQISAKVGYLKGMAALSFAIGMQKNPDGKELRDVLPADVHARWLPLRKKYLADKDGFERERPIFVAEKLYKAALNDAGLSGSQDVRDALGELARRHGLRRTWPTLSIEIDNPASKVRAFKKSALDDTACFATTLARLETDIDAMRVRANAWSRGDIAQIRALSYEDNEAACAETVLNSAMFAEHQGMPALRARLRAIWLEQVEDALARNKSSFAVLQIRDILAQDGYLAALAAKGYQVESPE